MNMTSTEPITDRRVLRTRRALRDALLSLLPELGWDALTVQNICDRADIGRSTFYVHFQGKDELLVGALSDLRQLLQGECAASSRSEGWVLPCLRGLIEHVQEHRRVFRAMIGRRMGHAVQVRFKDMVTQLIKDDLFVSYRDAWQTEATAHFMAGGIVEVLAWWVDYGENQSCDDMEAYCQQLIEQAVQPLLSR